MCWGVIVLDRVRERCGVFEGGPTFVGMPWCRLGLLLRTLVSLLTDSVHSLCPVCWCWFCIFEIFCWLVLVKRWNVWSESGWFGVEIGESNVSSLWISLVVGICCLICACFAGWLLKVYGNVVLESVYFQWFRKRFEKSGVFWKKGLRVLVGNPKSPLTGCSDTRWHTKVRHGKRC